MIAHERENAKKSIDDYVKISSIWTIRRDVFINYAAELLDQLTLLTLIKDWIKKNGGDRYIQLY